MASDQPVNEGSPPPVPQGARDEIKRRFGAHELTGPKAETSAALRQACVNLAVTLSYLPDSREKSLALTKLEEAAFWAQAANARG